MKRPEILPEMEEALINTKEQWGIVQCCELTVRLSLGSFERQWEPSQSGQLLWREVRRSVLVDHRRDAGNTVQISVQHLFSYFLFHFVAFLHSYCFCLLIWISLIHNNTHWTTVSGNANANSTEKMHPPHPVQTQLLLLFCLEIWSSWQWVQPESDAWARPPALYSSGLSADHPTCTKKSKHLTT